MELITCQNLSLGYDGKEIVSNLNFTVNEGDYLCIVGENGAGKSTLMRTLLNLQSPFSGKILKSDLLKDNSIGYLPQQTSIQKDFPASVKEIVLSGCQSKMGVRPFYTKKEKDLAYENMKKVGILDLAKRCYRELSGGQQQRVLLARALCATENILLLDEPVSGLDPKITADLYELINELNKKDKITIIMISHDINASLLYATHILHVNKTPFFGTKDEYMNSEIGRRFITLKGSDL